MKRAWYQNPGTWLCVFIVTMVLLAALTMENRQLQPPVEQNLQIQVVDAGGAYRLQYAQSRASGGVMNADGSLLSAGQTYGFEVGTGPAPVTVTALDQEGKTLFETVVSCSDANPCVLMLTTGGFVPVQQEG